MAVVTQLYLGKFPESNYMFRPLIEWAIIRLKQVKYVVVFREFSPK
jgi:hypothetical protein